jgi:hypothetical protein
MPMIGKHLRRHLVAYLALFVALSSTGYAASSKLLPKNSVGSAQVVNGSLQRIDLSRRAVASLRGQRGVRGPARPKCHRQLVPALRDRAGGIYGNGLGSAGSNGSIQARTVT